MSSPLSIRSDYGTGGSGVGFTETAQHPRIARVIRGLIDDIATRSTATIASPDGVAAAGAAPDAAEFDAVVLLVNEIKASLNAATGAAVSVSKDAQ